MRAIPAILLAAALLPAQQPTFRSSTRLVEVQVVVQDKDGHAVTGLKARDFEISDKGARREIAVFHFDGSEESNRVLPPLKAGIYTNRTEFLPGPPRNITALVLDSKNTPPAELVWARAQVTRYLRALAPATRVAVYHLGPRLQVLHDFTDDSAALRERVAKSLLSLPSQYSAEPGALVRDAEAMVDLLGDDPVVLEMVKMQLEADMAAEAAVRERRLVETLSALEALGRHLEGIPGRKNLVWITGGVPIINITGAMGFGPRGEIKSFEDLINRTARRLAQQGIALYVVDSKGLTGPAASSASISRPNPVRGRGRFEQQQQAEDISIDPLPASNAFASITGGRVIRNTNDSAEGLRRAAEDLRGAYTLGFYSPDEPDGKWHTVKIKTARSGLRLTYRQGYLAEAATPDFGPWPQSRWMGALSSPLGSSGLLLNARCERTADGLSIALLTDLQELAFTPGAKEPEAHIEIAIAELNSTGVATIHRQDGTIGQKALSDDPRKSAYFRTWQPRPDTTLLRCLVRDVATGRYGTLDLKISTIPNQAPAPVQVNHP